MKPIKNNSFEDRQKAAAEAKAAMLARFKPKPAVQAETPPTDRTAEREARLAELRAQRAAEKEARRIAREEAMAQSAEAQAEAEEAARKAKLAAIKERKANEKNVAQERRAAKLAAYAQFKVTGRKEGDDLY